MPSDTSFDLPEPTGSTINRVWWLDVDWRRLGKLTEERRQQIAYGSARAQEYVLEVGILCEEKLSGSDAFGDDKATELEGYFTGQDTSEHVFLVQESRVVEAFVWQEIWWRTEWHLNVQRFQN